MQKKLYQIFTRETITGPQLVLNSTDATQVIKDSNQRPKQEEIALDFFSMPNSEIDPEAQRELEMASET